VRGVFDSLEGVRRALAVAAALALSVGGLVVAPSVSPPAQAAPAAGTPPDACADLLATGSCTIAYAEFPDGATVVVPASVASVVLLIAGGSGGGGGSGWSGDGIGGAGALVFGELDLGGDRTLVVQPGDHGEGTGRGWADGGEGGEGAGSYADGARGGGATAVAFASEGIDHPFAVAGGGGGGGGNVSYQNDTPSGGGGGGVGGAVNPDGADGSKYGAANGAGGSGGGADRPEGQAGGDGAGQGFNGSVGGGGGGGGYRHGGAGGEEGHIATCNARGVCPPNAMPGAGGGGGAGDSYDDGRLRRPAEVPGLLSAPPGAGSVTISIGEPEVFGCIPSDLAQPFSIPAGVDSYDVLIAGGAGSRGSNGAGQEGSGALVVGTLDVRGIDLLYYLVGCDPSHDGYGYGSPGASGSGAWGSNSGGGGGGASLIISGDGTEAALVAAGGGGGAGGDAFCLGSLCDFTGGKGGSGGGAPGGRQPYAGQPGSGTDAPSGGCAGCMTQGGHPYGDGGSGSSSSVAGGGGGGGAGYPQGGDGGNSSDRRAGGGGGAGSSFVGSRMSDSSVFASGSSASGFIVLIPRHRPVTSLTVEKVVTGAAAAFGTGPFAVRTTCAAGGTQYYDRTLPLSVSQPAVFADVPAQTTCDVVEVATGGATVPAAPVSVSVGTVPQTVALSNAFALAPLAIALESVVPGGVAFDLGTLSTRVSCEFDGRPIALPAGGVVDFVGSATWNAIAVQTLQVPVGAVCSVAQRAPLGDPDIAIVPASVAVPAGGGRIDVTDSYALVSLEVGKSTTGSGTAPAGATYPVEAACTFGGAPVTLASSVVEVAAGSTAVLPGLPRGASCTLTESDSHGAVATTYSPSRTVVAGSVARADVENRFEAGGLHVSVSLTGEGAGWVSAALAVDVLVECTQPGDSTPSFSQTFAVPATGGAISASPDVGSTCTIAETATAGATEVGYPLGTSVVVPGVGAASLEVVNRLDVADVVVESVNTGAGSDFANAASRAVVDGCAFEGLASGYAASIDFGAFGGSGTARGIAVGAECDVVQTAGTGAAVSFAQSGGAPSSAVPDGIRVTVAAAGPTTVTIENDFALGALAVTNTLTGDAAWASNASFTVEVECTFNGEPIARIGPAGVATLEFDSDGALLPGPGATALQSLVVGAVCSALESAAGGATVAYVPAGAGRSGDVVVPGVIAIGNDFPATRLTLDVAIGGNDAAAHADAEFLLQTVCAFNGVVLGPAPGGVNPRAEVALADGQNAVYELLPVGAECETTELTTHHATQVLPSTGRRATLGAAATAFSFTNVFDVAPLRVRQVVTGDGAAEYGLAQTYTAEVECRYPDGALVALPDDGYVPLSASNGFVRELSVPAGASCRIFEPDDYRATQRTLSPDQTVTLGGIAVLEATTRFDLATITVETTAHGTEAATTAFDYSTACVWPGPDPGLREPVPLVDPADAGFSQGSGASRDIEVLMYAYCTVVEVDTAGALRLAVTAQGERVGLVADGADGDLLPPGAVTFAFENWLAGSLPITGAELRPLLVLAAALLLVGAALTGAAAVRRLLR